MGSMEHVHWFNRLTGNSSGKAAAEKADITVSTLNRQLANGRISAEYVIELARAYRASPVESLAATGYITQEEATGVSASAAAELLSDPELIRTLAYRINADPEAWFGTFGELADEPNQKVVALRSNKDTGRVGAGSYDGTVTEWDPTQAHAADSSTDEQAAREERGEDPVD